MHLHLRLRDREEELKGKAKLLDVWATTEITSQFKAAGMVADSLYSNLGFPRRAGIVESPVKYGRGQVQSVTEGKQRVGRSVDGQGGQRSGRYE